jgi:hypothetical protein
VLSGFTFDFSTPLDASAATNAADYQVDTVVTRKVKKTIDHVLHPITGFTVSYSATSDAVTIAFMSAETFPTGGQITVLSSVTTAAGGSIAEPKSFTISRGGRSITPE